MKKMMLLVFLGMFLVAHADAGRGRLPCSGSKGGISHCSTDGRFICNDGSLSQSKKICSGYGANRTASTEDKATTTSVKITPKQGKSTSRKKQKQQPVAAENMTATSESHTPTCAPLNMANQPGYTNLPICSSNQP